MDNSILLLNSWYYIYQLEQWELTYFMPKVQHFSYRIIFSMWWLEEGIIRKKDEGIIVSD